MFTGIVTAVGKVVAVHAAGSPRQLTIEAGVQAGPGWRIGDSVAVSGVCLTLAAVEGGRFSADLSGETALCRRQSRRRPRLRASSRKRDR
jgi:riboflavin synthase